MKQLVLTLFAIVLLVSGMNAQAAVLPYTPPADQGPTPGQLDKALLWKIEGNDLERPSYLFGTIHIIPSDDFFMPGGTENALLTSSKIIFEIDMNEMMDMGAQLSLLTKAFMSGNTTLSDLLNEEDYNLVREKLEEIGIPIFLVERIKPMFLSMFVSMDFDTDVMGGGSVSYEMEFFEMANENEIPVGGLETMEFQMSVFDSIPYDVQAEMLVETIKHQETDDEQFQELIEVYKSQDIEKLYSLINTSESEFGAFEDIFISDRNENWVAQMGGMMEEGPIFFAVGAGHLAGEKGVIKLLRAEGYNVSPVIRNFNQKPVQKF